MIITYMGSKFRRREKFLSLIPEHKRFIDPTIGAGSITFNKEESKIELISDIDEELINLYQVVKKQSKYLSFLVENTVFSKETFLNSKHLSGSDDPLLKALQYLTINRMSFLGLARSFDANREKHWYKLPKKIEVLARRLRRVKIDCLDLFNIPLKKDTFIFLDPPYLQEGEFYKNGFTFSDHLRLLEKIKGSRAKILLAGLENQYYNSLGWKKQSWDLKVSSNGSDRVIRESVWWNYETT